MSSGIFSNFVRDFPSNLGSGSQFRKSGTCLNIHWPKMRLWKRSHQNRGLKMKPRFWYFLTLFSWHIHPCTRPRKQLLIINSYRRFIRRHISTTHNEQMRYLSKTSLSEHPRQLIAVPQWVLSGNLRFIQTTALRLRHTFQQHSRSTCLCSSETQLNSVWSRQ
jgi:hypothetical protein